MKKLMIVLMASVLFAVAPALGGPLAKSQVSGSANWVVHTDYEQARNTQIGKLIRAELVNLGVTEKLENFATVFSFHPIDDVCDVTIYGTGKDQKKAVILIEGQFDKERLLSLVRLNPEYEEIKHGDILVRGWVDENKRDEPTKGQMYGCFYNDDLIMLSAGLGTVKQAIDVLNGSAENAASGLCTQAVLNTKGAFFQVAANAVNETVGDEPKAAALRQTKELGLAVGENEGNFYVDLTLRAKSAEAAQNINKVLGGIIGFATLAGEEQPKLAELAKKLTLSCANDTVQIRFDSESEAVFELLKEQWKRKAIKVEVEVAAP